MTIEARIQSYLGNGGLFNPEMMEHDKVRDLIMACRDELEKRQKRAHKLGRQLKEAQEVIDAYEERWVDEHI